MSSKINHADQIRRAVTEATCTILGLATSIAALVFIKKWLVPALKITEPHEAPLEMSKTILYLEVLAISLLFAAFVLGEVIQLCRRSISGAPKCQCGRHGLSFKDVALVLGALAGSLVIYASFVKFLGINVT